MQGIFVIILLGIPVFMIWNRGSGNLKNKPIIPSALCQATPNVNSTSFSYK